MKTDFLGCFAHPDEEATSTSEESVIFYRTTQLNNPEDIHLQGFLYVGYFLFHGLFITLVSKESYSI
jgi:hypothetical protein